MNLHSVMMIALSAAVVFEIAAYAKHRSGKRLTRAIILLGMVAGALVLWQPEPTTDRPLLGAEETVGFSVMVAVAVMFVAICLGIAARYLFEADRDSFDWFGLLRPLVVSPLLLLPLIGTLDAGELQPLQLISLAILSFQNGFFWQKVMENVRLAAPNKANGAGSASAT